MDPQDDSVRRWVVHHYRYDPHRRERRHVLIGAFDDEQEFDACIRELAIEVEYRRRAQHGDQREQVTGTVWEPGHLCSAAARFWRAAMRRRKWAASRHLHSSTMP